MYPLRSRLTNQEREFMPVRSALAAKGFAMGGAWEYGQGSFDCALDEANKVWLRLPFEVTNGHLDSESDEQEATIRFAEPFVLKHLYNEGLDEEARVHTMGALFDQFQDPAEPDANIEAHWIDKARERLREAEAIDPA